MEDKTEVRDAVVEAIAAVNRDLEARRARGHVLNVRDDAYRLFYSALVERADFTDAQRSDLHARLTALCGDR